MKTKIKAITTQTLITNSSVAGIFHPRKGMLHYRPDTSDKTIVPLLLTSKLFLSTNLTLNNSAKYALLLETCFSLFIHICTVCKDAVSFICNKIVHVLAVMNSGGK